MMQKWRDALRRVRNGRDAHCYSDFASRSDLRSADTRRVRNWGIAFMLAAASVFSLGAAEETPSVTVGVSNVVSRQRDEMSGLVDIDCELSCDDPKMDICLRVFVRDRNADTLLPVRHVWVASDEAQTNALIVKAGKHRLVWDAREDAPGIVSSSVMIGVEAIVGSDTGYESFPNKGDYMVIDLSAGSDAARYPVSYLDAEPQGGWGDEYKTDKLVLRLIRPGTFAMGSPKDEIGRFAKEVQRTVTISRPFFMGVFEVTQRQYALVTGEDPANNKGDCRPVERVSWNMVRGNATSCNWPLNREVATSSFMGLLRSRTGNMGFDLPTDAQWEYACRAGTTTALNNGKDLLTASGRDENLNEIACYSYNTSDEIGGYTSGPKNVGAYKPNAWGLFDMSGNVQEWCLDWEGIASSADHTDPEGPTSGSDKRMRGGSWFNCDAENCRSASGVAFSPTITANGVGFRVLCNPVLPSATSAPMALKTTEETYVGVTNVVSRQRYPWNGLVDIDCEVYCSDPATNINLYLSAKDNAAGKSLSVRRVRLEGATAFTNALEVKAGKHRVTWDAGTDAPNVVSDDVTIEVQALVGTGNYLVIDISGGPNAASYPVSYLGAEPQGGWTDEYKTDKLVLRMIQPGTFTMGCETTEIGYTGYEAVPHEVTISQPFYMGVFEVTQKQYELVTGSKPSCYKGDMRPVEYVSWNTIRGNSSTYNWPNVKTVDANTFMGRLRAKTGLDGFDLPTEAQWEYACRAGTTTALNNGKDLKNQYQDPAMDEVGRYRYNKGYQGGTKDGKGGYSDYHTTVGSYLPNAWGLYDMHGNVYEWCLDWYVSRSGFTSAAVSDPVGPASGSSRVMRGGGWSYYAQICRSAHRYYYGPSHFNDGLGFRLCCSAGLQ